MKFKRNMVLSLSTLLILGSLAGCSASKSTDVADKGDIVATYAQGQLIQSEFSDELLTKTGMQVMLDMVDKAILDELHPITDDMTESVNASIDDMKSYYKDDFEDSLKINGYRDEENFKNSLYLNEQRHSYILNYIVENKVTDEEVQAYYDGFTPNIEASHILISPVDDSESAIATAKEEAMALIARIDAGEDFATLAKEFSSDTGSGENGGELGSFGKGAMVPEFENAAFALKINEVTKVPVQSQFGFHIIKKTAGEEKASFEDMKDEISNNLATQVLQSDQSISFIALVELRTNNDFEISNPIIAEQYKLLKNQLTD